MITFINDHFTPRQAAKALINDIDFDSLSPDILWYEDTFIGEELAAKATPKELQEINHYLNKLGCNGF
ncbi:MAG: hypothetical protein CMF29_01170 [Kiritimatiellaceae bacterium]|nr:hypothetical protein [Kiritimatiellaceae bacterium]